MDVAIITGASKGIGKAIALALAAKNYRVVLLSRNEKSLQEVKREIQALKNYDKALEPFIFPIDITDQDKVKQAIDEVITKAGSIDVLINNAALAKPGTATLTNADLETLFKVNVLGAFNCIKAVSSVMKANKRGYIINIGSKSALVPSPEAGGYAATKLCLAGLTENMAKDLTANNIKVSTINPGLVDTHLTAGIGISKELMLTTDDIVSTVNYLLSLSKSACIKDITLHCQFNF